MELLKDVAVAIPVKNGGELFRQVFDAVLSQRPAPARIVCVDSGSKDGTAEFLRRKRDELAAGQGPQLTLVEIAPESFGHGKTRNLAVASCSEDFVALLTQDARPVGEHWLQELIAPLREEPQAGGAFGPHVAYPETRLVERLKIESWFERIGRLAALSRLTPEVSDLGELYFFSNNNSAIRRAAWVKTPFPDVEMGEDQQWAKRMLEAGWAKAFAAKAVVCHSHDFTPRETFRRQYDEMSVQIGMHGLEPFERKPLLHFIAGELRRDLNTCLRAGPKGAAAFLAQIPYSVSAGMGKWTRVRHEKTGLVAAHAARFSMQERIKRS